jgi:hypothetical protein
MKPSHDNVGVIRNRQRRDRDSNTPDRDRETDHIDREGPALPFSNEELCYSELNLARPPKLELKHSSGKPTIKAYSRVCLTLQR